MSANRCIIFVDTESILEGPWREAFDFTQGIGAIRALLSSHGVPAVFNVCGKLLKLHFDIFQGLEADGHEIALHGWQHENLRLLDDGDLAATLELGHAAYMAALKHSPVGFRAPWLEHDQRLTAWLSGHGYHWTSHRHMLFRERFASPGLRPGLQQGRRLAAWWSTLQEIGYGASPLRIAGSLWDLPLTSSMDGELLGLVSPLQASPAATVEYCLDAWMAQAQRHRAYFTLNVHDWLMATANRPALLDRAIAALRAGGFTITTATRMLQELDADAD